MSAAKSALFIVFEGPHASGKSFYAKLLKKQLSATGIKCVYTKEPYSIVLRPSIKKLSTTKGNEPFALFYLILADRMIHLRDIKNLLSAGTTVISDRYTPSTEVYQKIQGIPASLVSKVNEYTKVPDIIFYVDTPYEIRKKRIESRARRKDLFYTDDNLALENKQYQRIKEKLLRMHNTIIVDGQSKGEVNRIEKIVLARLNQRNH